MRIAAMFIMVCTTLCVFRPAGALVTVNKPTDILALSGPQLVFLGNWMTSVWADLTPAEVQQLHCQRFTQGEETGAMCFALALEVMSAQEYLDKLLAEHAILRPAEPDEISEDGSTVESAVRYGPQFITGALYDSLGAAVASVFCIDQTKLYRTEVDKEGGTYNGRASERLEKTAQEAMLGLRNGLYDEVLE